jgi:hypothetical protein
MELNQNDNVHVNVNVNANKRWDKTEEAALLKGIAAGKNINQISTELQRGGNAVQLRLKKIIHDNIDANKSVSDISKVLNLPKETISGYYHDYSKHLERQDKIKAIKNDTQIGGNTQSLQIQQNPQNEIKQNMVGGNRIEHLEEQNRKMKLLIENHILKKKLSKILKHTDYQKYKELLKSLMN